MRKVDKCLYGWSITFASKMFVLHVCVQMQSSGLRRCLVSSGILLLVSVSLLCLCKSEIVRESVRAKGRVFGLRMFFCMFIILTLSVYFFLLLATAGAFLCGVDGRPELMPLYWYFAFFSEGLRICDRIKSRNVNTPIGISNPPGNQIQPTWNEHINDESTVIIPPALSNSPQ